MEYSIAIIGLLIGAIAGYVIAKKQAKDNTNEFLVKIAETSNAYANVKNELSEQIKDIQARHLNEIKELDKNSRDAISSIQKDKSTEVLKIEELYREQRAILEKNYNEVINRKNVEIEEIRKQQNSELDLIFKRQKSELEESYKKGKEQGIAEVRDLNKDLNITATPVVQKITDKGLIRDDYILKAGVQYQLYMRGMPTFDPHIIWTQEEQCREINYEKLEKFSKIALEAAQGFIAPTIDTVLTHLIKVNPEVKQVETMKS